MTGSLADVSPVPVTWRVPHVLPQGHLVVLVGAAGCGKGTWLSFLVSAVTRGWPITPGAAAFAPGDVIVIGPEDDLESAVVPRLLLVGADLSRVHDLTHPLDTVHGFEVGGDEDCLDILEKQIIQTRAAVVIIDPLSAVAGVTLNTVRSVRRSIMEPLQSLAKRQNVLIVLVHHFTKAGRIQGSQAILDAARLVVEIATDGRVLLNGVNHRLRTVRVRKSNIGRDDAVAASYVVVANPSGIPAVQYVTARVSSSHDLHRR